MNPFAQLLRTRGAKPPVGTWIVSASAMVAEAVGHAGFNWGVLDMEHAPLDLMPLVHLLQAVGNTKMVPVVRVPWNDAVTVKRVLDAGAETLLFPLIQNADEAARAVAATRYAPDGVRGLSAMGRASRYGTTPDYYRSANRSIGVVVQLETPAAIAQLEHIAAVPGVDALFVGPADLSAAMGHPGQLTHPAVMALMADAAARARAIGRPIGTVGTTTEVVTRYRAAGYDFLAVASDLALLMQGAGAAVQALRQRDGGAHVHTLAEGTRTDPAERAGR
ncbi:MAG: 2-dehydro-3-deoxyglucarate aldolase [Betaproteobacteria bacterium]|nr:2-dehydro-3-deoxyglucarate aldolase [Betaproteobacteria bacterium]MCC6247107.1 2-dehydro-3-deoxyglucarate aldolase [Rubrivivax sp.]